jgi:hypothetical protein
LVCEGQLKSPALAGHSRNQLMQNNAQAPELTAQQVNLMRVEIDRAFRNANDVHLKTLYSSMKDGLRVDYGTFCKMLKQSLATHAIVGFKLGAHCKMYRDELQEDLQQKRETAHRQAPPAPELPDDAEFQLQKTPPTTKGVEIVQPTKDYSPFERPADGFQRVSKSDLEYLRGEPAPLVVKVDVEIEEPKIDLSKLAIEPPTDEEEAHALRIVKQPEVSREQLLVHLSRARDNTRIAEDNVAAWQKWAEHVLQKKVDDKEARHTIEGIVASRRGTQPPRIPMRIAGKLYNTPISIVDIKTLLFNVLGAEETDDGAVEFDNKRYDCDAELLARFIFYFFGGALRIEKPEETNQ